MTTGTLFYVLREGSTREEQWTWQDIEDMCRSGELSPKARIFLPDEDRWAILVETRLADVFSKTAGEEAPETESEDRKRMEDEYKSALERASEDPDLLEARLDAAILASQLGLRDEACAHFQTVLHRYPYHARAAQEVKRRFSRAELKKFRYLDRPEPAWEDLGELAAMPFARGPLYVAIPAAIFAALSWLPFGGFVTAALISLWIFQVMEYTARGANRPPEWNRPFSDPWRKLLRPALLMGAVAAQWGALITGVTWLGMLAQGKHNASLWDFLSHSPVALVLAGILALVYFPAACVSIGGFTGSVGKTLNPTRLARTIIRMEHEFVYTVGLVAALTLVVATLRAVFGGIPVFGNVVSGALLACAAPMTGLVLGRLLGRMGHLIE